jgi:hypothetical protein
LSPIAVYADSIFGVGLLAPLLQTVEVEVGLEESPAFPSLPVVARTELYLVNISLLYEPVVLGSTIKKRIKTITVIVVIPVLFISIYAIH